MQLVKQKAKWAAIEDGDHNASITTHIEKKIRKQCGNNKATKIKNNTRTIALERSVEETTAGFKALLQLANFTLGLDATLTTEIHKHSVRIKTPNSVNASKRKHKNQINHCNKQSKYSWLIFLYARVNENQ